MITLKNVEPVAMRYVTTGDWEWLPNGDLKCTVADYGNEDGSFLVHLHEIVEAWLCKKAEICEEYVSAFDIAHPDLDEPGDSPEAPYYHQHLAATQIERIACQAAGIDWKEHNDWVQRAGDEVERKQGELTPAILIEGPRFWTELHLFALRNGSKNSSTWLQDWIDSIPFNGCPCKEHLDEWMSENPPDWSNFFAWTIKLHNAVNDRIGKRMMTDEDARQYWLQRHY